MKVIGYGEDIDMDKYGLERIRSGAYAHGKRGERGDDYITWECMFTLFL